MWVAVNVKLPLQYNFTFTATHIPGLDNSIADSLSRFQMDRFRTLAPSASPTASTIPPSAMNIWEVLYSDTFMLPLPLPLGKPIKLASSTSSPFVISHVELQISVGNSMISSDIWHKYYEWYFKIVIRNFTSRQIIWDNFEISRAVFMPNITYKSYHYLFILLPAKGCNFHM